jgi:hypothetical protein
MYDEPERKRRREYVNIGSRSVRTQHMGSPVYSCSREIASGGVEIVSKVSLNAFRPGWKFTRIPLKPGQF